MKNKILIGGLGLVALTLIYLCLSSYYKYMIILSLKLLLAIITLIALYIIFIKILKNDKDKAQELDYRKPAPNVAKLKRINKRLGKS